MKNKFMGILLSVVMATSSMCVATVSAEDFAGETQLLETEEEETLEMEEDTADENLVEFGSEDELDEGELSASEESNEQEEISAAGDEASEFTDDASGETETTELELDKVVSFELGEGEAYSYKYFSFKPAESGFYHLDYEGDYLNGYAEGGNGENKKIALFYGNPFLVKDVMYCFNIRLSNSVSKGSVKISRFGDSTDAYENCMAAGKSENGKITWKLSDGTLEVEGTGEVSDDMKLSRINYIKKINVSEGITGISEDTFSYMNNLTEVSLPSSLKEIGSNAFYHDDELAAVKLSPDAKLKKVGVNAFYSTPFFTSQTNGFVMLNNIVLGYNGTDKKIAIPETATLLSQAFAAISNIEELDLTGSLKTVSELSASYCYDLKKIRVGSNVTDIEYAAFVSNTELEAVELNEGVEEIGKEAFLGCENLKKINIPKTVTTVGEHALGYSKYVTKGAYNASRKEYVSSKYDEKDRPVISCWYGTAGYDYAIKEEMPYEILDAKDLSNTTTTEVAVDQQISGSGTKVLLTVKFAGMPLKEGTDYTWSSTASADGRQLKISVKGCGDYFGTYETTVENKGYKPAESKPAASKPASLKKGTVFKVGTSKYKVTGAKTVAYAGTTSKKAKKITIGKTVTYRGVTYKITSVVAKALKNNKKVKQVTIGANVTYIGTSAFQGCRNLSKIKVNTKVLKTVKSKAFKGISSKAKIKVPSSKLKKYRKLMKKNGQGSKVRITK